MNATNDDVVKATTKFLRSVLSRVAVRVLEIDAFNPDDPETKDLLTKAEKSLGDAISAGLDAGIEGEREECIKVVEELAHKLFYEDHESEVADGAYRAADSIRARGKNDNGVVR